MTDGAEAAADKINNAGNVFIGPYSPVAAGDYFAGPNHTIPTSGKAKFFSAEYGRFYETFQPYCLYKRRLFKDRDAIAAFAEQERFFFHAAAALRRKPND